MAPATEAVLQAVLKTCIKRLASGQGQAFGLGLCVGYYPHQDISNLNPKATVMIITRGSRNLRYYQTSPATAVRSIAQVNRVTAHLGTRNLLVIKTPGMAAYRELGELRQASVVHSTIVLVEHNPKNTLPAITRTPGHNKVSSYYMDVFDLVQQYDLTQRRAVWLDLDLVMSPASLISAEVFPGFAAAVSKLLLTRRELTAITLTLSVRDSRGKEYLKTAIKIIHEYLKSFDRAYDITCTVHKYQSTNNPAGPGTPRISLDYLYTPKET